MRDFYAWWDCDQDPWSEFDSGGGGGGGGTGLVRPSNIDLDEWERMNPQEKLLCAGNPFECGNYVTNAKKALAWASALAHPGTAHNNRYDALRHAYWSALLARDINAIRAERWTDAHEVGSINPLEESMDKFNNAVGRSIANGNHGASDVQLRNLVLQAETAQQLRLCPTC